MKMRIKTVMNEITRTRQSIDQIISEKPEREEAARKTFEQRRKAIQSRIDRVREVIQNKQP